MKKITPLFFAAIFGMVFIKLNIINKVGWNCIGQWEIECLINNAESGDMKAQTDLGYIYGNGEGVEQDNRKAIYWYDKAARQGYMTAQNNLSVLYLEGTDELPQDYKQACSWFSVAFFNGLKDAAFSRDKIAIKLSEKDLMKAKEIASIYTLKYSLPKNGDDDSISRAECEYLQ
ncbi:tetratricopeptide repeat protein [Kluyvera intermedia]|uniref:tetratricopeptide repeat protein n=1 Tax=Kluyvera intermedia TaxID=61648 RepID=UPI00242B56C5|nr:tetratricopeptide repeat protein [Kluyvera intermedia]WEJ85938.1 MAG: tetratricopeptide repeat protein [Kluyvera intermedia]